MLVRGTSASVRSVVASSAGQADVMEGVSELGVLFKRMVALQKEHTWGLCLITRV